MYCINCGKPLTSGVQFCGSCGARTTGIADDTASVQRQQVRDRMVDNLAARQQGHVTTPEQFQPLTAPAANYVPTPPRTQTEVQVLERQYRRNRLIAFIAPIATLFGIIALWGFFAVLDEISVTEDGALETIGAVVNLLIPILIAMCVLAIPAGIIMGIVYTNRLQNLVHLPTFPPGVSGWNWGAFWLTWIWSIRFRTWIGLLALIPYVGLVMMFVLGSKGSEWAWQNNHWNSVEEFKQSRHRWNTAGFALFVVLMTILILSMIVTYADFATLASNSS